MERAVDLDPDIYRRLANHDWFVNCGTTASGDFTFPARRLATLDEAVESALSDVWQDARTEAQG